MRLVSMFLLVSAAAAGCGKGDKPPPPSSGGLLTQETGPGGPSHTAPGIPAGTKPGRGAQIFAQACAACHGPDGRGQTDMAKSLRPPPRDYTDAAWQASVTDDDLRAIITRGGAAVGKSSMMPPNQQLASDPAALAEVIRIIRGFARK